MFCPQCGQQTGDDAKFCPQCGNGMPTQTPPTQTPPTRTPPPPVGASPLPPTASPPPPTGTGYGSQPATASPPPPGGTPPLGTGYPSGTPPAGTISGDGTRILGDMPPQSLLSPGTLFDQRYLIQRQLGEGGMGAVYLAHDQVTSEAVCLKVVRAELLKSATLSKRFLREGKISRSLRHPNVVSVYDVNAAAGAFYISMEYLEGQSLRTWLRRIQAQRWAVPLARAINIAREVLLGLGAAHAADLVHRDLKPENVMLLGDPGGADFRLKILDFGIARAAHEGGEALTVAGSAIGTPAYMAPEQEMGADNVGPAADLYSVGAIFYELLVGMPPRGRWSLPTESRRDLPPTVDRFMEKALQGFPENRFQSVGEMISALDNLARSAGIQPGTPVPGSPGRPMPPPVTRPGPASGPAGGVGYGPRPMMPGKEPLRTASGQVVDWTLWSIWSWFPLGAAVTWFGFWRYVKKAPYLVWACVHLIPWLPLLAFFEDFDEDVFAVFFLFMMASWIAGIVQILVMKPKIIEDIRAA